MSRSAVELFELMLLCPQAGTHGVVGPSAAAQCQRISRGF